MDAAGVLSGSCAGAPNGVNGQITVSGTANQNIEISVGGGTTDAGVTFNPLLASNGTTDATDSLGNDGTLAIGVNGSIDITSATPGLRTMSYTFTVSYL